MSTSFGRKLALLAGLEFLLAAIVLMCAFLCVFAQEAMREGHLTTTVVAQVTFALSFLIPGGLLGIHRFSRAETLSSFLQKFCVCIAAGLLLCYAIFEVVPTLATYRGATPLAVALGAFGLLVVRIVIVPRLQIPPLEQRVLILGTTPEAIMVANALAQFVDRGVSIVGFYQTDTVNPLGIPSEKIVGNTGSLERLVDSRCIDLIVVAVREQRGGAVPVTELLNCRLKGTVVTDVMGVMERIAGRVPIAALKSSWLIYGNGFSQGPCRRLIKRAFDVVLAAVVLIVESPLMLLTAIAIYLESGRPIIFRQERVGYQGRTFWLLKFRSMRNDAEQDGTPRWASRDDARITRVGRIIRRTHIDELPQLWNVLRGDMSFVGPRPERPFFVDQLTQHIPYYRSRHSVKPGITGWAQVRYGYGGTIDDAMRKLEFDLYYMKNHSLFLDVVILFKTIRVVLLGEEVH